MTTTEIGFIGRDSELSRLSRLVDPPPTGSHVQVLLGEPGMGKTVLLAEVTRRAGKAGLRVLAVTGRESERDLAFAGLHQLLRPVLDRAPTLPDRQAQALRAAFALSPKPVPPDALLTGIAALTLLSGLAEDGALLVAVDDAQWLDHASLDTLAFAARRLESEPLALLLAARGTTAHLAARRRDRRRLPGRHEHHLPGAAVRGIRNNNPGAAQKCRRGETQPRGCRPPGESASAIRQRPAGSAGASSAADLRTGSQGSSAIESAPA